MVSNSVPTVLLQRCLIFLSVTWKIFRPYLIFEAAILKKLDQEPSSLEWCLCLSLFQSWSWNVHMVLWSWRWALTTAIIVLWWRSKLAHDAIMADKYVGCAYAGKRCTDSSYVLRHEDAGNTKLCMYVLYVWCHIITPFVNMWEFTIGCKCT